MTLHEINQALDKLPKMDVVRLSGGEPFLRKDLPEIVEIVSKKIQPILLHITTNGWLYDRIIELCKSRSKDTPLEILVSLDGMKKTHDHQRGRKGMFDRCIELLQILAPMRKDLNLTLAVNQTITNPSNIADYTQLHERLRALGVSHQVVFAYEDSALYHGDQGGYRLHEAGNGLLPYGTFSEDLLVDFFHQLTSDLRAESFLRRTAKAYYLHGLRNRLIHGKSRPNPICVALGTHMRLLPNGDVPTCLFNEKVVGNLIRHDFNRIWAGEQANRQREWVKGCSGCFAECEVLPNAVYTGDLVKWLVAK